MIKHITNLSYSFSAKSSLSKSNTTLEKKKKVMLMLHASAWVTESKYAISYLAN